MGWCVDCHRTENTKPDKKPDVHAPLDCVACHH
jgi:hypothetical protein